MKHSGKREKLECLITWNCYTLIRDYVVVTKICYFSCINEQLKCAGILLEVRYEFQYSLEHCSFWGTVTYVVSSVNEYL